MGAAWKNIWFIYKDFYDVLHNTATDTTCDLTQLSSHSLGDRIKSAQHICVITNWCSFLLGPVVIRHTEWLYLSGAKDNSGSEALHADPEGWWWESRWGKDTSKMKEVCNRKNRRMGEWWRDGENTIKGNECHCVTQSVWLRCFSPIIMTARGLVPFSFPQGKSLLPAPNAGLVIGVTRDYDSNSRSSLLDKEPWPLHS